MSACKTPLPKWWAAFEGWRQHGGLPKERPAAVPRQVPQWAWDCYRERHPAKPKPAYQLPFKPPVAFYRAPDDLTVGITEALDVFKGDIAIDPLNGDWTDIIRVARARGRKVYGWTRVGTRGAYWWLVDWQRRVGLDGLFPNIEDDDLRTNSDDLLAFLEYVQAGSETRNVGVLTNYNVSNLWPKDHPLSHLPVLPEWFPSEIHDPTATLEGSLDSGRKHFAAALPLLDGRERGLAAFPYPAGAYCVWPADNVTDWAAWVRS